MQKKTKKVDVVVFDFDGTLSAHDANIEFGKYCFKNSVRPWLFLPLMVAAAIGRVVNRPSVWWRESMRRFLSVDMLKRFSGNFIKLHKMNRFGWAYDQVAAERAAGNIVVLISASPDYLLYPLVCDMEFDAVICSEMDAKKPWKYKFLCWGQNKVFALNTWAKKQKITPRIVRSYSDSTSDMPLMKLAREQVWINHRTGCRISK